MRRILPFLFVLLATSAHAEAVPKAGPSDKRIKVIDFDPNDVVLIVGREGFTTDVRLNDDEKITQVALGNSEGWWVAPINNHLILKPKADPGRTNALVLTDKGRTYNLVLTTADSKAKGPGGGDDQFFQISFRYPAEVKAKEDAAKAVDNARSKLAHPTRQIENVNYFACGDLTITPDQVFDDGRFTYLRFSGKRQMPAVYTVAADGTEEIPNKHVEADSPDTIVVHQLAQKMVFRMGKSVGCIVNKSYDAKGVESFNGTTSNEVERVTKGVTP